LATFAACAALAAAAPHGARAQSAQQPDASVATPATPACNVPFDLTRLDHRLERTARRLAAGEPLTIVAIGSSSTAGAGASSPAASYPSRLAEELQERFPYQRIAVLNRGVNGEEARDMLARFDAAVIAEKPDLVIWQVGTNTVLRDHAVAPTATLLHAGLTRLKQAGADVILIDPQFAPKVLAKRDAEKMIGLIAATAKALNVDLFHRFAVMRHWRQVLRIPYETFLSSDGLHHNDWSYACLAELLARAITEAALRPTLTATAAPAQPR
jgi:lysophospholipase L1-like esterase